MRKGSWTKLLETDPSDIDDHSVRNSKPKKPKSKASLKSGSRSWSWSGTGGLEEEISSVEVETGVAEE